MRTKSFLKPSTPQPDKSKKVHRAEVQQITRLHQNDLDSGSNLHNIPTNTYFRKALQNKNIHNAEPGQFRLAQRDLTTSAHQQRERHIGPDMITPKKKPENLPLRTHNKIAIEVHHKTERAITNI